MSITRVSVTWAGCGWFKPAAPVLIGGGYSDRDTQVAIKNFRLAYTADEVPDTTASRRSVPRECEIAPLEEIGGDVMQRCREPYRLALSRRSAHGCQPVRRGNLAPPDQARGLQMEPYAPAGVTLKRFALTFAA